MPGALPTTSRDLPTATSRKPSMIARIRLLLLPALFGLWSGTASAYELAMYVWTAPTGEAAADCELVMVRPVPERMTLGSPSWSADESKLAFNASYHGRDAHLFVHELESGQTRHLGSGTVPSWNPDGEEIVFRRVSNRWKTVGVYALDADLDIPTDEIDERPKGNSETDDSLRNPRLICDSPGWPFFTPDGRSLFLMTEGKIWTRPSRVDLFDLESETLHPITMPEGVAMRSVANLSGERFFTVVAQDGEDETTARVSQFHFGGQPGDGGAIAAEEQTIVTAAQMDALLPDGLEFVSFVEPRGAIETGDTFVSLKVRRTNDAPDAESGKPFGQIWLFPAGGAGQPHAIVQGWPGVALRDFAPNGTGSQLVFCSDLIQENEQDDGPKFAEDFLVEPAE